MNLVEWISLVGVVIGIIAAIVKIVVDTITAREKLENRQPQQIKLLKWLKRKYPSIKQFLKTEMEEISESVAPGSTQLNVEDVVTSNDVYISPKWSFYSIENQSSTCELQTKELEEFLLPLSAKGERILLLGDPGQGKSTLLKRIFFILANNFEKKSGKLIPIYIPCRDLDLDKPEGGTLDGLYKYLNTKKNSLPVTDREFRDAVNKKAFVFLFDGFDEIEGSINQAIINQRVNSEIFLNPGILSCRTHFYEIHMTCSPVDYQFPIKIILLPLDNLSIQQYVTKVCVKLQSTNSSSIIQAIEEDPKLGDLSKRLLLLVMITDIFTKQGVKKSDEWNTVKLYDAYTDYWLKNESRKSILNWDEKSQSLEVLAWELFTAKLPSTLAYGDTQKITITRSELRELLVKLDIPNMLNFPPNEIVDDICSHTFLAHNGENYHFLHRSLQEYYVAKFFFRSIKADLSNTLKALRQPLPVEIATFLKEMIDPNFLQPIDVEMVTTNLIDAYTTVQQDTSEEAIKIREQAGYYLSRMITIRAAKFLEDVMPKETDKWVKRGIIIGLIYKYNKSNVLDDYLTNLHTDKEADAINLGYHLEYYGDQAPEGDHKDKKGIKCDRTIMAIIRHLKNPEEHRIGWALDLITLRRLLESRGLQIKINLQNEIGFLGNFLNESYADDKSLNREVRLLRKKLEEFNIL